MTDQLPFPGPEKGTCEGKRELCSLWPTDGCPKFGALCKPSRDGRRRVKGCRDRVARNARNRRSGSRKQRAARKAMGIAGPSLGADHEEHWRSSVRHEVKSGAQVRPAWTAYLRMETQSESDRPIGDNRPFAGIAMPAGTSDGLVLVRLSNVLDFAYAVVEHDQAKD